MKLPDGYSTEIDKIETAYWSALLDQFSDATMTQTMAYGSVRWGRPNLSHFILKHNQNPVCAAQVRILKMPIINLGIAYISYGPVWQKRKTAVNTHHLKTMIQALKQEYAISRKLLLRIRPHGFDEMDSEVKEILSSEGFALTKGHLASRRRTVHIDLSNSEDELRRRLHKKWRQSLNKAEKSELAIIECFDDSLFDKFELLFNDLLKKKRFRPDVKLEEFRQIQRALPQSHRMRITICERDGTPVSGSVCSPIGDTVIGILSATSDAGRSVNAYYFLQWEEITWCKQRAITRLDLGGINSETNPSVYRFKSRLRGREVTFLGVYDYSHSRLKGALTVLLERSVRRFRRLRFLFIRLVLSVSEPK